MPTSGSLLKQLSTKDGWKSTSKKWSNNSNGGSKIEGFKIYGGHSSDKNGGGGVNVKKRVMVVVDGSSRSKHAMMWALTHVTNMGDFLTLLHVINDYEACTSHSLAASLASLCKASNPEVEVEAVVVQGPKLATVLSQVKKLEVSVLVLGQKKHSPLLSCFWGMSNSEEFVEQCINNAECLTIGVKKQSKGMGGYLISTRWQKNFWLLA
ncbi:hypothetical protein vseg_019187 [Gypsophila vaccaria]